MKKKKSLLIFFSMIIVVFIGCEKEMISLTPEPGAEKGGSEKGSCVETYTEKEDIRSLIQSYDMDPLPNEAVTALKAGCAASSTDLEIFMTDFLCAIEASTSFKNDSDIQEDVDNLEHMDTSDLENSCVEIEAL